MEIRILGPVTIIGPDGPVALRRNKERLLLAVLAIEVGRPIPVARVLELLTDNDSTDLEGGTLTDYAGAIRTALQAAGGSRTMLPNARRSGHYLFDIDPQQIDYQRFRRLILDARQRAATGSYHVAIDTYQQALDLWHGEPLAGIRTGADGLRRTLQDEHHRTVCELLTQQLHAGHHTDIHETVARLIEESPPTDQLIELGLHALARSGQHTRIPAFYRNAATRTHTTVRAQPGKQVRELAHRLFHRPETSHSLLSAGPRTVPVPTQVRDERSQVRFTLPPDTIAFTGRTAELATITATIGQAAQRGGVVAIHAIDGMPGIGKTTLAVHAAHQLADRYPDGQMFVDLHAHTPGLPPTAAIDALADLLRADGVEPRKLPDSLDARAALWRDRMAGRRALLVLDNAQSTSQVSPLLPGSEAVLVLITSRRRLSDLRHAAHLDLTVLPHSDAVAMFVCLAPRAAGVPDAVDAIAELVRICEYLPLAIAILASRFAAHPTWTMNDLLADFQTSRERLVTVKSENATVHAAFELSYQHLPPERQRFFRLLGLTPGVDIDSYAAAALTATSVEDAAEHLDELYNDHLLDETAPRRYRMHDLIRVYTHALATTIEPAALRNQAVDRLLDYYQHTAYHADTLIAAYSRCDTAGVAAPTATPDLPGWDEALAWLRAERPNLQACLHHATTGRQHRRIVNLTASLATLLRRDGPWTQANQLHQNAITAALHTHDRASHAGATSELGRVRRLAGDYSAADNLFHRALSTYSAIGDRLGQANTLHELGRVQEAVADYHAADNLLNQALTIYAEIGDRRGQAVSLTNLGVVHLVVGDYPGADNLLHQALTIYAEIGDRRGQADARHDLGVVRRLLGDYPAADNLLHQALTTHTEIGDRRSQANVLPDLAVVRRLLGDYPAADNLLHQALAIYNEIGDRFGQAVTLNELGVVRRLLGDYAAAEDLLHQAMVIATAIGDRHGHAIAKTQLGVVRYLTGDHGGAEDLLQQALTSLRDMGVPDDEVGTLDQLGILHRLTGQPDKAATYHHEAFTLASRIHHRLEQAHALEGIGRAAFDVGDQTTAITHLSRALNLYQQLGVPEADNVAAILADLDPLTDE